MRFKSRSPLVALFAIAAFAMVSTAPAWASGKPLVETKRPTAITSIGATLNSTVNPEGEETKYWFEYGTTESYGTSTAKVSIGSGTKTLEESKALTALPKDTKYHYRVVASNASGTTDGADQTFSTLGKWSDEATASLSEQNRFEAVSCTSSTACTAVGYESVVPPKMHPIAERWNALTEQWSTQEVLSPGAGDSQFTGVSCTSATSCIAIGYLENSTKEYLPFAESWNGTKWSLQEVPRPAGNTSILLGIMHICRSMHRCRP